VPETQIINTATRNSNQVTIDAKTKLAPIALFLYARPDYTEQTIDALRANEFAAESDLFVFADGPKDPQHADSVAAVRKLVRSINGFKSVTLVERERNYGLSRSIIAGTTQLCNEFGRAIVVEDDIITAPDFLRFTNHALDRYAGEPKAFSVCSFHPAINAPKNYNFDAFWSYRFSCWGWATWKDRWEKADWVVRDYPEFAGDAKRQARFDRGGGDLSWFLNLHMQGRIDSWDTLWAYSHFKHDAFALLPVGPKTFNIGLDGSGTHCKRAPFEQHALADGVNFQYRFPGSVEVDPYFVSEIQRVHRPSMARKVARFLQRVRPKKKRFEPMTTVSN